MKVLVQILLLFLVAIPAYSETSSTQDPAVASAGSEATISGTVVIKGKTPMTNGIVLLYDKALGPPPSTRYWRVPDMMTGTDDDGGFTIQVPKGTYYLQVAQKNPDGEIGPPKGDEYFYFHGDARRNPLPITITSGDHHLGTLKASIFTASMVEHVKGITSIRGIILDNEGKPVKNALVFAYLSEQAIGRPIFISNRSDQKGRYTLRVHDGGTFYLKVRSVYGGGKPQAGEFLNVTNEFTPLKVSLKKHQQRERVNLKVKKFSRPGSGADIVQPPEKKWRNIGNLQTQ